MSTVPGLEGASARFAEPPQDISSVEGDQTVLASESQEVAREERQKSPASDAYADADVDADADADAEGEVDLVYALSEGAEDSSTAVAEEIVSAALETEKNDPFLDKEGAEIPPAEEAKQNGGPSQPTAVDEYVEHHSMRCLTYYEPTAGTRLTGPGHPKLLQILSLKFHKRRRLSNMMRAGLSNASGSRLLQNRLVSRVRGQPNRAARNSSL